MRICQIWDADYPWDVRVEKVCDSLLEAGHEVHLVCRNRKQRQAYEKLRSLHVHRLPEWTGGNRAFLGFPFFLNPFWLRETARVLSEYAIEVILVRDLPMALTGVLLGKLRGIPCAIDMAEPYPEMLEGYCQLQRVSWKKRLLNGIVRNRRFADLVEYTACRYVDHVFAVSPEIRENLIAKGVEGNKISVVHNTPRLSELADSTSWASRLRESAEGSLLTIVYVGDLTEARGVPSVVFAIRKLLDGGDRFKLVIVGTGRYEEAIRASVRENNVSESVEFLGFVPHEGLPTVLGNCDIGIIPHIGTRHNNLTLPNKIFDYMAVGLPVVTTDLKPIERIVEETGAGIVYRGGKINTLVDALRHLKDSAIRDRMRKSGLVAVAKHYNWQNDFQRLESTLQRLCAVRTTGDSQATNTVATKE